MQHKKNGVFYILPLRSLASIKKNNFEENLVYDLTQSQWRLGKKILIACESKSQAQRLDEFLWNKNTNSFLPHDLYNKNTYYSPITLSWKECCYDNIKRDLLINLMKNYTNFFFNFNEIIDFVPPENFLKQLARSRYKFYKKIGFNLRVIDSLKFQSN